MQDAEGFTWLQRRRLYLLIAAAYFLFAVATCAIKSRQLHIPFNAVTSDGRWYYVYLTSVAVDGDLDFTNQVREHWDVDFSESELASRTPLGLPSNRYPIGFALSLAPVFFLVHALAKATSLFTADGYAWPYQIACLAAIEAYGLFTFLMVDRILTRHFQVPAKITAWASAAYWIATPYAYYYFREPFMEHVVGAFWCTSVALLSMETAAASSGRPPKPTEAAAIGFSLGMAVVCRPTNVIAALFVLPMLVRTLRNGWVWASLRCTLVAAISAAAPLSLQLLTWKSLFGSWVAYSYGEQGFSWLHPALWQTLFSTNRGLFVFSPLLVIAAGGLVAGWVRNRISPWAGCLLVVFALNWYVNSSWWCWWFGNSFGGRAFLDFSLVLVAGLAFAFERFSPKWTATVFAAGVLFNYGLMALHITHRIPRDSPILWW